MTRKHKYSRQEDYGKEGRFERCFAGRIIRTVCPPGKHNVREVEMTPSSWPGFVGIIDYNFKTQTKFRQKIKLRLWNKMSSLLNKLDLRYM